MSVEQARREQARRKHISRKHEKSFPYAHRIQLIAKQSRSHGHGVQDKQGLVGRLIRQESQVLEGKELQLVIHLRHREQRRCNRT
jgi:hypothetical protein